MVIGKFLANKLGITQESVEKVLSSSFLLTLCVCPQLIRVMQGKHANIMSAYYDWKPSELKLCNKLADESYKEFVTKYERSLFEIAPHFLSGNGLTFISLPGLPLDAASPTRRRTRSPRGEYGDPLRVGY